MAGEAKERRGRVVPWFLHFLVLAVVAAALGLWVPFLLPLWWKPLLSFAALSSALFPLCRRSGVLFLLNYLVSAGVAVALVWTG